MTEDDVTEIKVSQRAREAAADIEEWERDDCKRSRFLSGEFDSTFAAQAFARFEQAVRADERERAAKVADGCALRSQIAADTGDTRIIDLNDVALRYRDLATAIRAQGDEA